MSELHNHYKTLGIARNATTEEVIAAVKQLVKISKPENFTDSTDRAKAQEKLKIIKLAYETLKDENLRLEYDLSLVNDSQPKQSNTKNKTRSFKFISGLILGTAAVTAGATVYFSNLDCSNQRNVVDATICEKTQPIRSLFGSDEKQPVVAEASKVEPETIVQDTLVSNQTPVEASTPEIEQPKNEPAPALASATVSFDNSTPVKSEPELPTATASFQPVASTPVATTNNANDECYNLWYQRNLIYAQNGYCFTSNLGKEAFKDFKCFTSSQNLPNKDQVRANNLKSREAALNCNVDTNSTTIPTATKNVVPVQNQVASISNSPQAPISESYSQSANANPIQTLVAEGVGITPQDAAQNAAENALKNVVGAFIDSNMNLEKKTLIYDGLKSETKNISKDIKEYSQGSIKSFEIIDVQQQAGLYRLKAKVAVRNEQFSAYVKQLAKGETQVDQSIYTRVAVDIKQKENLKEILQKNIFEPLVKGEVQEFIVSKPVLSKDIEEAVKNNQLPNWFMDIKTKRETFDYFVIKVKTKIKQDFLNNLNKTLIENSSEHKEIGLDEEKLYRLSNRDKNDTTLFKEKIGKKYCEIFIFKNVKNNFDFPQAPNMRVVLKDDKGETLSTSKFSGYNPILQFNRASIQEISSTDLKIDIFQKVEDPSVTGVDMTTWTLLGFDPRHESVSFIIDEKEFYILLKIDVSQRISSIDITLEQ